MSKEAAVQKFFAPTKFPNDVRSERAGDTPPAILDPYRLSQCSTPESRELIPHAQAVKLGVLPMGIVQGAGREILILACAEEPSLALQSAIRFICNRECRLVKFDHKLIEQATYFAYLGSDQKLSASVERARKAKGATVIEPILAPDFRATSSEAGELLCSLVDYAVSHTASDLHLIPLADGCHVKLRVNSTLRSHQHPICGQITFQQLVNRIKVLAKLNSSNRSEPQDGAMELVLPSGKLHIRVGIIPSVHGEKVALRFHSSAQLRTLAELQLPLETEQMVQHYIRQREGALLVAGATGSGKTSSMYAILMELASRNRSCVTLEDPVEIKLDQIVQCAIDPQRDFGFPEGLRAVLRQDPDVIMLGEIRDAESARIALQAAITGHLLLSTVHARNFYEVFLRLEHFGIDQLTIAQSCSLILCQKLIPTLCEQCKVLDLSGANQQGFEVYQEVGCARCDYSGFAGQILLCAGLECDEETLELLSHKDQLRLKSTLDRNSEMLKQAEKALIQGKISAKQFASLSYRR